MIAATAIFHLFLHSDFSPSGSLFYFFFLPDVFVLGAVNDSGLTFTDCIEIVFDRRQTDIYLDR